MSPASVALPHVLLALLWAIPGVGSVGQLTAQSPGGSRSAITSDTAAAAPRAEPRVDFGTRLVWLGGAALLGAFALDDPVHDSVARDEAARFQDFSDVGDLLGRGQYAAAGAAATTAVAWLAGRDQLAASASRTLGGLLAAEAANGILKVGVGRGRPHVGDGTWESRPFNIENRWQSFPSGHAVTTFALAAAISAEARTPWVTGITYGAGVVVSWSRLYEDKHYLSDVIGGALVGTVVSRATVRWLRDRGTEKHAEGVAISVFPGGIGVRVPLGGRNASLTR